MINANYLEKLGSKIFLHVFEAYYNAVITIKGIYKTEPKEWDEAYKVKPPIKNQL